MTAVSVSRGEHKHYSIGRRRRAPLGTKLHQVEHGEKQMSRASLRPNACSFFVLLTVRRFVRGHGSVHTQAAECDSETWYWRRSHVFPGLEWIFTQQKAGWLLWMVYAAALIEVQKPFFDSLSQSYLKKKKKLHGLNCNFKQCSRMCSLCVFRIM